ncbi:MAG TPA: alpha/beta hydrolase-fold protein [Chloroflexota bacterium]
MNLRRLILIASLAGTMCLALGAPSNPAVAAGNSSALEQAAVVPGSTTEGTLLESSFPSPALGLAPPFRIYLPPGYDKSTARYPVLYLLHGNAPDSDYTEWSRRMQIDSIAGSMIDRGEIVPMIIVMPYGAHSYFMNVPGGPQWADYISQDFVQYVDAHYRTLADADHRAIGGNSMGGTGALHLSFNHPDLFSIVGGHSPALRVGPDAVIPDWAAYTPYDPLRIAETAPGLDRLKIWLDDGDQDPWRGNTGGLHERLAARGISHTWNLFPGMHDNPYWLAHAPDYLRFYSASFRSATAPAAAPAMPAPAASPAAPVQPPAVTTQRSAEFRLGFKVLADALAGVAGVPVTDERYAANGDSLQQTTTGLMVWRKADNWTAFTDGYWTWVNGPYGPQQRGNDERFDWETSAQAARG